MHSIVLGEAYAHENSAGRSSFMDPLSAFSDRQKASDAYQDASFRGLDNPDPQYAGPTAWISDSPPNMLGSLNFNRHPLTAQ